MPETHDALELLTTREAAAIARVDVSTVNKWVRQGNLPAVQREPQIMIDSEALDQFLRQRTPPTQTTARVHDATTDDAEKASRLLAIHEAADIAGVSVEQMQQWVESESLRAVHRGWRRLIDSGDLEQFLRDRKPPAQAASTKHEAAIDTAFWDDKPGDLAKGMPETHDSPQLLTTNDVAALAQVNARTVLKWVENGHLRIVQRYPKLLVDREDLEHFLHERKRSAQMAARVHEAATDDADGASRLLTVKEAAAIAQVHPHTVQKWVAAEQLPVVQRRPKALIDPEDLDQFLNQRTPPVQAVSPGHQPLADDVGEAPRLLTAKEAAAIARVDASTIRRWVRQAELQAIQRQPQVWIDPEDLDQFLNQRTPPVQAVSPRQEPLTDAASDPAQGSFAMIDVLPEPTADTPNERMWRTLVLVLQRELEATKAREARLMDLLDQATRPPTRPRRRIVSEMTLVHRIREHLEAVGRPQRAWQIQKALKLDKAPYRELSRLVSRGEIRRLREGVYAAVDLDDGF